MKNEPLKREQLVAIAEKIMTHPDVKMCRLNIDFKDGSEINVIKRRILR